MNVQQKLSKPQLVTTNNMGELRPELREAMTQFATAMAANRQLPQRLVELMRLRVAFHNQCRPCMSMRYSSAVDDGLTEGLVCSLERPEEPGDLTPAERAAVNFADRFATDHLSITAEDRLLLCEHFNAGQVVELAMLAAFFTGFGRMGAVLDTGDTYPVGERRADGVPLTPWGIHDPMIV